MELPNPGPKTSQRAFNRQERPPSKRAGAAHHRDYRVVFASGVELEVTNCRSPGIARMLSVEHQRTKGRKSRDDIRIVKCERLPHEPGRHEERLKGSAKKR